MYSLVLCFFFFFFFFKQKTAYEMRISDWSSDVCSSDLHCAFTRWGSRPDQPDAAVSGPSDCPAHCLCTSGLCAVTVGRLAGLRPECPASLPDRGNRLIGQGDHHSTGIAPEDRKSTRLNSSH